MYGFEGGTTERIVQRAGVAVGSLYQYFPNKGALLRALMERYCAEVMALQRAWLDTLATEDPPLDEGLRAFIDWLVVSHAVRPRLRCLMFEERPIPPEVSVAMATLHRTTIEGLAAWLTGRVAQPLVTAHLLSRTVSGLVHHFVLHPQPDLDAAVMTREVFVLARAYLDAVALPSPATPGP